MKTEKAKVHYISSGQNHIVRNKDVVTLNYKDFDICILDEEKQDYPCLLYKDQIGEYWMFYYVSVSFERFISLLNNECNDYDKYSYTNYCDFVIEKVKPIYDNLPKFFKEKIDNSKYFNCIELSYLEKYYPELYSDAKKSREQFLKTKEEQKIKHECEEKNRRKNKVKEKNQILKDKVENMKESILTGKEVVSEVLNFYKDNDYEKETYQNNFLYLLKEYGIEVPLKTQGYINNKLHSFNFGNSTYRMYGKYSCQTLFNYFDKLKEKVLKEKEISIDKDLELEM